MNTGTAEESRLKQLLQEADNERRELRDKVRTADLAISELQNLRQAQQQRIEDLQVQLNLYIASATKWEARFDRLLCVVSGQTTDAEKWGAAIEKIRKWTE